MYKQNEISVKFSTFNHMERPEAYITPDYDKRSHEEALS
jgi:hypothetical protein